MSRDAIALLEKGYRSAAALFKGYRALASHGSHRRRRKALADQICLELTIQMRLEEEVFYPAVREALHDEDLMDDSEADHASVRGLVAQLLAETPDTTLYDAKLAVLAAYVARHADRERAQMFSRVRRGGVDMRSLGKRLARRRRELRAVPQALREDALIAAA